MEGKRRTAMTTKENDASSRQVFWLGLFSLPLSMILLGGIVGFAAVVLYIMGLRDKKKMDGFALMGLALGLMAMAITAILGLQIREMQKTQILLQSELDVFLGQPFLQEPVAPQMSDLVFDDQALQGPMLVMFFALSCPPCDEQLSTFSRARPSLKERGLEVVGFCVADEVTADAWQLFLDEQGPQFPLFLRPSAALPPVLSKAKGVPSTVFVDKEGLIQAVHSGQMNSKTIDVWLQKFGFRQERHESGE
jgi:peroxiredoxin